MRNLATLGLTCLSLLACLPAQRDTAPAAAALQDGPHLFHQHDGSVQAVWIEAGVKKSKTFAKGAAIQLPQFVGLLGAGFKPMHYKADASVWPEQKKLLAISDVEGNYDGLLGFLRANKVIDKDNRWAFGAGHLVAIGDMVDRGDKVTEVLWLMRRLGLEAKAAGGMVHHVLGNHEAMVMGGDVRYVAAKYREVSRLLGKSYEQLVGADSEIGRWLRSRNSVVKVGGLVFVHGGLAPEMRLTTKNLDSFNQVMRELLGKRPEALLQVAKGPAGRERDQARMSLTLGWRMRGPYWYRGYFSAFAVQFPDRFGPLPTNAQLDAVLQRLQARTILVGHTKVKKPTFLFGHRVLAIDTPWTDMPNVRGIMLAEGVMYEVDRQGRRTVMLDKPASQPTSRKQATSRKQPAGR